MKRAAAAVCLVFVVVYLVPLGAIPLTSPDETRYAEIPREMIHSGDWVVPRLNGLRYFEKPPLGYWLTALSITAFGENNFAVRLPAAVSAGLTAAIIAALLFRFTRRPLAALLGAVVYLTSLLVFVVGSIATLDSMFTLFLTGTLAALLCACEEIRPRIRVRLCGLAGVSGGLAFLTKGFLALVVPAIVVAAWVTLDRRWRDTLRIAALPLLIAVAVALPWSVLIQLKEPDFWRYFFWVEHVRRFLDPVGDSQHPEPVTYFLPVLVAGIWPWLPLAPAAILGAGAEFLRASWARRTVAWFVLPFVFFSASTGKLTAYILPCFPPLALLIAIGLVMYFERGKGTRLFFAGALAGALVAFAGVVAMVSKGRPVYSDAESWKWMMALAGLACCGLLALTAGLLADNRKRLWIYCAAPLPLMFALHFLYPRSVETDHAFGRFFRANGPELARASIVVTDADTVHAACWYLKRTDVHILAPGGELAYGLGYEAEAHRRVDPADVAALLTADSRTAPLAIVMGGEIFNAELAASLDGLEQSPAHWTQASGLVFLDYEPPGLPRE